MAYEARDGSGALFRNDRKTGQQPDYRGNIRVGGVDYELAGWLKDGKDGKPKWLSLKAQPAGERAGAKPTPDPDSVPF